MKIGFVTCVALGLECLEEISAIGGRVDVIFTLDDDVANQKSGRVYLDDYCDRTGTRLIKVRNINDPEALAAIKEEGIDLLLVIGWSQILNEPLLRAVNYRALGMHPTLLPVGRGRAPIPWTILKGLSVSGVTLFELAGEADTGRMAGQVSFPVAPDETATTLYAKSIEAHRALIRKYWDDIVAGKTNLVEQDESRATHWEQRRPSDGLLSADMTTEQVERLVRAISHPYPGAFFLEGAQKVIVWSGHVAKNGETGKRFFTCTDGNYVLDEFEVLPV